MLYFKNLAISCGKRTGRAQGINLHTKFFISPEILLLQKPPNSLSYGPTTSLLS